LVPDSLFGQNIIRACQVHDYDYEIGGTLEDKRFVDTLFLLNGVLIIDAKDDTFDEAALQGMMTYYIAVSRAGDASWNLKEESTWNG